MGSRGWEGLVGGRLVGGVGVGILSGVAPMYVSEVSGGLSTVFIAEYKDGLGSDR